MAPPNDRAVRSRLFRMVALAVAVVVALAVLVAVFVVGLGGRDGSSQGSDRFEPTPGSEVPSATVVDEIDGAIATLLAEQFVRIEATGYGSGRRSDFTVAIDAAAGSVRSSEVISPAENIGDRVSDSPMLSEFVLIGSDLYVRVLQPDQDRDTPFQKLDATGLSQDYLYGAYTQSSRVFGSLDVLARLVREVPFEARRLNSRTIAGDRAEGVSAAFASADVAGFLAAIGEVTAADHGHDDELTAFEFWSVDGRMVQLVATGVQFQDGEAIDDTAIRITYRIDDSFSISAPGNTVV